MLEECFEIYEMFNAKVFYFVIVKIVTDEIMTLFPDNKTHTNRETESQYISIEFKRIIFRLFYPS